MKTYIAIFIALAFTSLAMASYPTGVLDLVAAGRPTKSAALANPNVDGISLRQDWAAFEPAEGSYDCSYFDTEIARAAAAGKYVLLRVGTGADDITGNKPAWLYAAIQNAGGTFVTVGGKTIPVFWDPTLIAKEKDMLATLAGRYADNPAVRIVNVAVVNANTNDWSCPDTSADITAWKAAGYTSQKVIDTGVDLIDSAISFFPAQTICISVGQNSIKLDPQGRGYVATTMVNSVRASHPASLIAQMNSLSATTKLAPGTGSRFRLLWDLKPNAWQMLRSTYGDPTYRNNGGVPADPATVLTTAVDIGAGYGANYIEIYEKDVINLPGVIAHAHSVLSQ
jgi:glycosyl hydrolase family 42 (putative beta-galactosidase)